jgi:hypothetical protein
MPNKGSTGGVESESYYGRLDCAIANPQFRQNTPNKSCTAVLLQAFTCTDEYATENLPLLILKDLLVCLRAVA